jgi:AcrR family transcriptional regulator
MGWKRARSPEQKEQRRGEILEAAAALVEREGLEGTGLNAIAREAGISKANIYRYFESREAILLNLVHDDYQQWAGAVERALAPLAGNDDEAAVVHALVETVTARPRLATLASSLTSVLERNVSVDAVVWFKTAMMEIAIRLANAIQVSMPSLTMDRTQRFLMAAQFLLVGMWPASNPPPAVAEALQRPELSYACVDFAADLEAILTPLLTGLKVGTRPAT